MKAAWPSPGSSPRTLPADYAIGRVGQGEVMEVCGRLRGEDRAELAALEGRPTADVLRSWIRPSSRVLTIGNRPAVVYGVEPCADLPRHAIVWTVATASIAEADMNKIMWLSRLQVDLWQRRWPVLLNVCDARHAFRRHWLEWLGFESERQLERFGTAAIPFHLYRRDRQLLH